MYVITVAAIIMNIVYGRNVAKRLFYDVFYNLFICDLTQSKYLFNMKCSNAINQIKLKRIY